MAAESAGLLLYRRRQGALQVLLVHPGGPFWARRDLGAWSIPKGEIDPGEDPLAAAQRELEEETGFTVDVASARALGSVRQSGGKRVIAWAVEADVDPTTIRSNAFPLEWPPHSGHTREFPEVDRAAWFDLGEATRRILAGQQPLLEALQRLVSP